MSYFTFLLFSLFYVLVCCDTRITDEETVITYPDFPNSDNNFDQDSTTVMHIDFTESSNGQYDWELVDGPLIEGSDENSDDDMEVMHIGPPPIAHLRRQMDIIVPLDEEENILEVDLVSNDIYLHRALRRRSSNRRAVNRRTWQFNDIPCPLGAGPVGNCNRQPPIVKTPGAFSGPPPRRVRPGLSSDYEFVDGGEEIVHEMDKEDYMPEKYSTEYNSDYDTYEPTSFDEMDQANVAFENGGTVILP
eukprot:Platyproteum_vivax@DN10070_c0_g1_i1.p1